ncbi:protein kinase family protein, partial [Nostocoides japonicum]|uniref:protein kinase family protein n=1 Tax=Nostocoides japonicum TaxID=99481 RepID=UPI001F1E40F1
MRGVGPGTVLGGRYALSRRLDERDGAQIWQAEDSTLQRAVSVLVVPSTHPHAAALLDAARRSALVDNSNLARVHDVGQGGGVAYVVEESLAGAQSVAELARDGGMPAEEVRRVAGLVSRGLEAARKRGLHHSCLSPRSVVRTTSGDVKVVGLATSAALRGVEDEDADSASREDVVGTVAIVYAGLTGLWPLDSDGAGLSRAPSYGSGPTAPSEVAAGVPGDLDALCRLTLTAHRGPQTPGELARELAPWSHEPVEGVGIGSHTREQDGGTGRSASPTRAETALPRDEGTTPLPVVPTAGDSA